MRQFEARWFRYGQQAEQRLWCHFAGDSDLEKRKGELDLVESLGVIHTGMWLERIRVNDEIERRRRERYRKERCPICGGWRIRSFSPPRLCGIIPCCRDCGWPHAENIYGSNIIYPGPRFGFKVPRVK